MTPELQSIFNGIIAVITAVLFINAVLNIGNTAYRMTIQTKYLKAQTLLLMDIARKQGVKDETIKDSIKGVKNVN